jgi:3D (Asp-Asp-Asp) domain-containing protein
VLVVALVLGACGGGKSHATTATTAAASQRSGFAITEYWPVPEAWFKGKAIRAPGLTGLHRVDWLYSGTGLAVEADGIGLDGRRYHVENFGTERWVNPAGQATKPTNTGVWTRGDPAWRADGGWRDAAGAVTFPLAGGAWSHGPAAKFAGTPRMTFGPGPSRPLRYWESIATDPRVIPKGSRVYIPAYHRWFVAEDTGSGIIGRHIDVFRPPPKTADGGRFLRNQRILVSPPTARR